MILAKEKNEMRLGMQFCLGSTFAISAAFYVYSSANIYKNFATIATSFNLNVISNSA